MTLAHLQQQLRPSHAYQVGRSQAIAALRGAYHDCSPQDADDELAFVIAVLNNTVRCLDAVRPVASVLVMWDGRETAGGLTREDLETIVAKGLGEIRAMRLFARLHRRCIS